MDFKHDFTKPDLESIEKALLKLQNKYGVLHSIESLFNDWLGLIAEIKEGYDLSSYDYWNDIDARRILEEIVKGVGDSTGIKIKQLLLEYDCAFKNITIPFNGKNLPDYDPLWLARIPADLDDDMKNEFGNT